MRQPALLISSNIAVPSSYDKESISRWLEDNRCGEKRGNNRFQAWRRVFLQLYHHESFKSASFVESFLCFCSCVRMILSFIPSRNRAAHCVLYNRAGVTPSQGATSRHTHRTLWLSVIMFCAVTDCAITHMCWRSSRRNFASHAHQTWLWLSAAVLCTVFCAVVVQA
jgi:hypothetical protein